MNPLDLTGPEFLRFYIPYGLCVVALARLVRALLDRTAGPQPSARWLPGAYPREGDAYAIAFLRGGRWQMVETVLARLVSTGLVHVESRLVRAVPERKEEIAQLEPIEREAWSALASGVPLSATEAKLFLESSLDARLQEVEAGLAREGLLPVRERPASYRVLTVVTWLAVGGLGLAKLGAAILRGKWNVGFLILLLIGFTVLILVLLRPPRQTYAARKYLDWLQESHRGLVRMLESGRRDSAGEMALAAGIYGLAAVPGLTPLALASHLPAERPKESSSSSVSGCGGSGCGSGGSSCGGGCGGGGCGGCGGG